MKNYFWRYDTKQYKTKKQALEAVGTKEQWNDFKSYIKAKKSITKEYYFKKVNQ